MSADTDWEVPKQLPGGILHIPNCCKIIEMSADTDWEVPKQLPGGKLNYIYLLQNH